MKDKFSKEQAQEEEEHLKLFIMSAVVGKRSVGGRRKADNESVNDERG